MCNRTKTCLNRHNMAINLGMGTCLKEADFKNVSAKFCDCRFASRIK